MSYRGISPIISEILLVAVAVSAAVLAYTFIQSEISSMSSTVSSPSAAVLSTPPRIDSAVYDYETNMLRLYVRADQPLTNTSVYVKSGDRVVASAADVNATSCSGDVCIVETNMPLPANCEDCYVVLYTSSGIASSSHLSLSNVSAATGSTVSGNSTGTASTPDNTSSTSNFSAFSAWEHNKIISIDYDGNSPLADYQIRIELNSSNFNFSLANPDGSDIRFADMNGTELNYWIQEWNSESNIAIVWVKVPVINPPETNILMFYGNPSATSESNGYGTFIYFQSWENGIPSDWNNVKTPSGVYVSSTSPWDGTKNLDFNDTSNVNGTTYLGVYSKPLSEENFGIGVFLKLALTSSVYENMEHIVFGVSDGNYWNVGYSNHTASDVPELEVRYYDSSSATGVTAYSKSLPGDAPNGRWYYYDLEVLGNTINFIMYSLPGYVEFNSLTYTVPEAFTPVIGFREGTGAAQEGHIYVDALFVRKLSGVKPVVIVR